jgi:diguanylate cyclase (GGDEF)-like protein
MTKVFAPTARDGGSATTHRSRLLVIEDDLAYAGLIVRRLRANGFFDVAHVAHLLGALDWLAEHAVDCILLDLSLPDATGLEALQVVHGTAPTVAIIVLTGNDDEDLALRALAEGAQDFIFKGEAGLSVLQRSIRYAMERTRQGNELAERESLSRSILDALSSPTVLLDAAGRIVSVNAAWSGLQRMGHEDNAIGEDYVELCRRPPTDLPPAEQIATGVHAVLGGTSSTFELDYSCGEKEERRWYSLRVTPYRGGARGAVVTHLPITRLKLVEEELAHQALHDQLTGLPNRRLFFDRMAQGLARAARASEHVAVIYVDIDHFKSFNDTFGHAVGDAVLIHVSRCLGGVVRPGDTVGRMAGDEFVLLIEHAPRQQAIHELTARLTAALREPFTAGGRMLRLSASVGVATSQAGDTPESLLARADQALYSAKRQGRDRVVWDGETNGNDVLARELPAAITQGALRLHAQPIVRLPDGEIAGHELLVRWQHPQRGLLLPNEFIPEAERSGAIIALGRWVLGEACKQLTPGDKGFISINVSATQLQDPALVTMVRRARDDGMDITRLCLEITESAVMADLNLARTLLSRLRVLGARVAVDDFGAGQTSLRYLHDLPVDILKIDRSLISRLASDDRANLIVTAVVELGRALGLDVVGEGAETAEQAAALELLGCPLGQGYRWAEPGPIAAA